MRKYLKGSTRGWENIFGIDVPSKMGTSVKFTVKLTSILNTYFDFASEAKTRK